MDERIVGIILLILLVIIFQILWFETDVDFLNRTVGAKKLLDKRNKYQRIRVLDYNPNEYGVDKCMILDNEIQLCKGEEHVYHEMISHFPAYYIKNLRHVVIVGGGDLMALREIMRYKSVESVTVLELDNDVIIASKKYFKVKAYENDSRVSIKIGDASKTIHELSNGKYDLIIVDSTEDNNNNSPLETNKFFEVCKRKLTSNGILIKNGFINKNDSIDEQEKVREMHTNLREVFQYVVSYYGEMYTYGNDKYGFVMCSDYNHKRMRNNELRSLKHKLKYYKPDKQNKYIASI